MKRVPHPLAWAAAGFAGAFLGIELAYRYGPAVRQLQEWIERRNDLVAALGSQAATAAAQLETMNQLVERWEGTVSALRADSLRVLHTRPSVRGGDA